MLKSKAVLLSALSLSGALLLASCNQSATPAAKVASPVPVAAVPTTPSKATASPIYELQFRRSAQGQPIISSIKSMQPQAIRPVSDPLTFIYVSSGTLNTNGQWYTRVTYNVTNHSTQTINALSLLPLDTDSDGSTSTAAPTTGTTYFKDVLHFDTSDASDMAASLVPAQAVDNNGTPDASATPFVPVNSSGLNISLPAGLKLGSGGVSPKGWQLAGSIAPGATVPVTFATQMPAKGPADPFFYTVVFAAFSDVTVPVVLAPVSGANPRLDLPATSPAYVNGTLGDPTDPASTTGLQFKVAENDSDAAALTVSVDSSDPSVALSTLSGNGATRTLTITPQKVGKADITVTVTNGSSTVSYTVKYAASQAAGATSSTRFFSGISNASTAQDVGGNYMLVADDEFNTLGLFPRDLSGVALNKFDFTSSLNLTDTANPEMDLEASARLGNRIYWLASHSNSKKGNLRTNRYRVFATDVSGSGAATTLSYVGRYDHLRDDLLAWDSANGNALGLSAGAAQGVVPEADGGLGFNMEGMAFAPGGTAAYLGFRAPLENPQLHDHALIVPVTNLPELVTSTATTAQFGTPILLDLGGRGIRELKCNDQGCLILAGTASSGSNFALYSWSGKAGDAPHLRNDLGALAGSVDGSFESIVNLPDVNPDSDALTGQPLQLLVDNGDTVYYGDGVIAKDLVAPAGDWQKSRAETISVGALPTAVTPPTVTLPNVAVYRVGQGSASLSSAGTAVFIDTINPNDGANGAVVNTVALPTTAGNGNNPLVASGTASSEGLLTLSVDGKALILTGYGAALGTANISSSASKTVPRIVGRIDAAGNVNTATAITDAYSANNIRSAASVDGSGFYVSGGNSGVRYYSLGSSVGTSISATTTNLRQLNIFGGQLYVSSGSGTNTKGVLSVGSGLPTTTSTTTRLNGLSDTLTGNSYSFYMADLSAAVNGPDTLYIADGTSGIQKFSFDNTTWTASGIVSGAVSGLTGINNAGQVTLFAVNAAGTQLLKLADTSGYGGALTGTPSVVATAKTNTVFRGVALAAQP